MEILRTYEIVQGETLHSISQKVYGSIEHAYEIALANGLDYPFIARLEEEVTGNVKRPGDIIIIPVKVEEEPSLLDSIVDEDALGSDLLLENESMEFLTAYHNGDIPTNQYGDLQHVVGVGSLKQDIIHKLVTLPGSLVAHPDWGSNFLSIIGNKNMYGWREKASIELEKCIRSDDRVVDVQNIELMTLTTGMQINCDIITRQGLITLREVIEERGGVDIGL